MTAFRKGVAQIEADVLIILTNVGLYDRDPSGPGRKIHCGN
jgi:glutamate 5-kinase